MLYANNRQFVVEALNFTEKDRGDLIESIGANSLDPLKRNGLIVSHEKQEGLHGLKYLITLPLRNKITSGGIGGSEGNDWRIGMK